MNCEKCSFPILHEDNYCYNCGSKIQKIDYDLISELIIDSELIDFFARTQEQS